MCVYFILFKPIAITKYSNVFFFHYHGVLPCTFLFSLLCCTHFNLIKALSIAGELSRVWINTKTCSSWKHQDQDCETAISLSHLTTFCAKVKDWLLVMWCGTDTSPKCRRCWVGTMSKMWFVNNEYSLYYTFKQCMIIDYLLIIFYSQIADTEIQWHSWIDIYILNRFFPFFYGRNGY